MSGRPAGPRPKLGEEDSEPEDKPWSPELAQLLGRRLAKPRAAKNRVSVPERLARGGTRLDVLATPRRPGPDTETPPWSPPTPSASSSAFARSAPSFARTAPPSAPALWRELDRRKRQHPRLRWPRLTQNGEQQSSAGFMASSRNPLGAEDAEEEGAQLSDGSRSRLMSPSGGAVGPIVIGPESVFYSGSNAPLAWPWPPPCFARVFAGGSPGEARDLVPSTAGVSRGGDAEEEARQQRMIMPRARPHEEAVVGSVATSHDASARAHAANHRSPPPTAPAASPAVARPYSRQPPVSSVMASRARSATTGRRRDAGAPPPAAPGGVDRRHVKFGSWGLDDDYVASLCAAAGAELRGVERIDLPDNRLTGRSVASLLSVPGCLSHLRGLNLAGNRLGAGGGAAAAELLLAARPRLTELELSGNLVGDRACEELCAALEKCCKGLQRLGLARSDLGCGDAAGAALGALLPGLPELTALDLHWNRLHGAGALALCQGIYDNNCTMKGQLRRIDLSWNMLGLRCGQLRHDAAGASQQPAAARPGAQACACPVCAASGRTARTLAHLFEEGRMLFHLDLSYNGIGAADCAVLGEGLRANHTLFGLHLVGNEAAVDDQGFIVPHSPGPTGLPLGNERQQLNVNDYVHSVPALVGHLEEAVSRARLEGERPEDPPGETPWGTVQRDANCCWICDHWVEQRVSYVPGWSGDECSAEEVVAVFALFSIDCFSRATPLSRTEEPVSKRALAMLRRSRRALLERQGVRPPAGGERAVPLTAGGRLVRWVGSRMLPPTTEPIEVVFQVNGRFVASDDLLQRPLAVPKTLALQPLPGEARGGAATALAHAVNSVAVAVTALERYSQGEGVALCVLEDPMRRGEAAVLPRAVAKATSVQAAAEWSFETSSFAGYARDSEEVVRQCFDHDWRLSKLPQYIKDAVNQELLCDLLRRRYGQVVAAFHLAAFRGCSSTRGSAGVGMNGFSGLLQEVAGAWLFCERFKLADCDTVFVVSNVLGRAQEGRRRELRAVPEGSLARFQFLEAVVRAGVKRAPRDCAPQEAMQAFLDRSRLGEGALELRRSLHACLFTEECCLICRENMKVLRAVYESYGALCRYPGRLKGGLAFGAWLQLLADAGLGEAGIAMRDLGVAFVLGKERHVDDVTSFRHMELSWPEFLVALGGVVRLQDDFHPDFFADMLSDLFVERITLAHKKHVARNHDDPLASYRNNPSLLPLLQLIARVFVEADRNQNGSLEPAEFYRGFSQPSIQEGMREVGLEPSDVNVLFQQIDADSSGEVTLDELAQAFIKMKLQMRGLERAVAAIRKVFAEKDRTGSGSLPLEDLRAAFAHPGFAKALKAGGVSADDVQEVHDTLKAREASAVRADHFVSAFLRLRDPARRVERALVFLRSVFLEADLDGRGALSRAATKHTFGSERVSHYLGRSALPVPDWLEIFDECDLDGDNSLSWVELKDGVTALWHSNVERRSSRKEKVLH